MTVAYLDCEFNGYKGDLISLALVIDDNNYFYTITDFLKHAQLTIWLKAW